MPSWTAVSCFRPIKSSAENSYGKNKDTNPIDSLDRRSSYDNRRGLCIVELVKKEGATLGLIISGGIDKGSRPKISHLRPGSIAHRSDCLAVGDCIISVNGIRTTKLKHDEIISLLKNAEDKVILEIEYEIPSLSGEGPLCVCPKVIQLQLEKENESFGFTVRGGTSSDKSTSQPLVITHVRLGGPANREGSIKSGDRLLAVDGVSLTEASLQEALNILQQIDQTAVFSVEYDISVIDVVRNASGPLLVEIDKTPSTQLGINLTCLRLPESAIVIESIRQASVAERCGALHVGDHVLAIDDYKVNLMTTMEAMQLLKSTSTETVKLEIFPISQMIPRRIPETNGKRGGTIPHYVAARASFTNSCYNTFSSMGSFSVGSIGQLTSLTPPLIARDKWISSNDYGHMGNCISSSSSNTSLITPVSSSYPSIGHADVTEIILPTTHKGYGFTIQNSSFSSDVSPSVPYICSIENGSSAENSGVLQVGDRILAVNGEFIGTLSVEEVQELIMHSHPKLLLKIEFNVAEAVVPSSGTFVVKLVKRGEGRLGITVTGPKNRQSGDPLIISSIEKGSVAHRSGTIQPGDKLLAVDEIRMENCSVEDATEILQSCNDIVTLRIRKDELFSDDPDVTSAIIYTVELARHGGPLGITISGAEEPFVPICISGLTENGLAERTGALHVGDKILAINGSCLRGMLLSEVVQILQTCGDIVTLKISRNPNSSKSDENKNLCTKLIPGVTDNYAKHFMTPLPSIDSALESWDSCNSEICTGNKTECKSLSGDCFSSKVNNLANSCQYSSNRQCANYLLQPWDNRSLSAHNLHSFSGNQSKISTDGKENWSKVLEDLQTCGQSQLLRQIECKILGHGDIAETFEGSENSPSFCNDSASKCHSDTLSEQSLQELNAQIEQLENGLKSECEAMTDLSFSEPTCSYNYMNQQNSNANTQDCIQQTPISLTYPLPIEVHKVILFKDQVYEDFGFSISDGLYDHGVYINRIRAGGPADISGLIKPYDRILQVNNMKTYDHDCCLTVPLIAASEDRIELVISRPAYEDGSSSDSTLGRPCIHPPWLYSTECNESLSPFSSHVETQTLTKTL